jgi:hypothetical protein
MTGYNPIIDFKHKYRTGEIKKITATLRRKTPAIQLVLG